MPENNIPLIAPILLLLRSRKFILTVVGLVLDFIVATHPDLVPMREELLLSITAIIAVIIGGISYEDGKEKSAPTTITTGSAETVNVNQKPTPQPDESGALTAPEYTGRLPYR